MAFRIHKGIFQSKNAENVFENKFKIDDESGALIAVDAQGAQTAAFLRTTDVAVDSNLLDGLDSSSFLRSDTNDDLYGTLTIHSGGANTYGRFRGYPNDNHFIVVRGIVSTGTSSLTITGGHRTTFVEHAENNDTTGWYFVSKQTGSYTEVARITRVGITAPGYNKSNWDSAYNWGNHASAGYLSTSYLSTTNAQLLTTSLGVTGLPYSCDIVVYGESNMYYPVHLIWGDQDVWRRIIIKRGYAEQAPSDWYTATHKGGLLLDWEGNFGGWGGATYSDRLRTFNESYSTIVASMYRTTHSMGYTFFLRGGGTTGAVYHIFSDQAIRGFRSSTAPDIAYDTEYKFYENTTYPQYDVYAPAPMSAVDTDRINSLRTLKRSELDAIYYTESEVDTLLAGKQAAGSYAAASHNQGAATITSGTFQAGRYSFPYQSGITGSTAPNYSNSNVEIYTDSNHVPTIGFHRGGVSATALYEYDGQLYVKPWTTRAQIGLLLSSGNIGSYAWTSGNDGAASGLDADLLDGLHASSFLRSDNGVVRISTVTSGVSLSVGNGTTHGVYTSDDARNALVVGGSYYPHIFLVASGSNNSNHGAVLSFVGTEGSSPRQWNMGTSNQNPFLFSIGYNSNADTNPHYGLGDNWSSSDANHARLLIDRSGNVKIRGSLYVNGTKGAIDTGSKVATETWVSSNYQAAGSYAAASHTHDDRYYTETEVDTLLAGKLSTSGKAADAQTVDGIDSSRIVYGDGANGRSVSRTDGNANTSDSSNASGFYFGTRVTGMPTTDWWNWVTVRGNSWSGSDGYHFQLAGSFWSDDFRIRRMQSGSNKAWVTLMHSGNIGSQSVNYAATAGALTSMNISQFTNNSGYITSNNATGANGNFYIDDNYGYGIVGAYSATRYQGIWAMGDSYKLPGDGTTPGSLYGLAWTYNPDYGGAGNNAQAKPGLNHQMLLMMNGRTYTALGAGIWTDGTITTTSHGTSANWNTAYGWGNHGAQGYLKINTSDIQTQTAQTKIKSYSNAWAGGLALISQDGTKTFQLHPDNNGWMYTDNTWYFTSNIISNSGVKLGVGTTSPSYSIHAEGTIYGERAWASNLAGANRVKDSTNIGVARGNYEETTFVDGGKVLAFVSVGNGNSGSCFSWFSTENIPVDPNKDYEFSVWVKSDGSDHVYMGWHEYTAGSEIITSNPYFHTDKEDTAGGWMKITARLKGWQTSSPQAAEAQDRWVSQRSTQAAETHSNDGVMHSNTAFVHMRCGTCYGSVNGSKTYFYAPKITELDYHIHDDRYYTESEVDTLLAGKQASGSYLTELPSHNHDGRYYTESEVDTLLAAKAASSHTHDDRYYTESEVDTLLAGKQASGSYAAASHNHDGTYQKQVDEQVVDLRSPNASSGTWNTADGDDWGTPRIGAIAARYADGSAYLQFNVPSGMDTAYISQLTWSSGGYADIYGIQADGGAVFLRRINTKQNIENSNEGSGGGNPNQHDGSAVTLIGTGLSTFSAVRIQNREGRIHLTGMSFTSNRLVGTEGTGLIHPAQLCTTTGLNADTLDGLHASSFLQSLPAHTHDDRYYTESEVDTLLAGKQAAGTYLTSLPSHDHSSISGTAQGLAIRGYGSNSLSFQQTSGSFAGYSGWANHFIGNHGDGSNYYNTVHIMPFWGAPKYSRLEGGEFTGLHDYWTSENFTPSAKADLAGSSSVTFSASDMNVHAWTRIHGANGIYFQTYGYGLRSPNGEGVTYGNIATYGTGRNGWSGYSVGNWISLMSIDVRRGLFLTDQDRWLIKYDTGEAFSDYDIMMGSDARNKSNVQTLTGSLDKVKALRGVSYNYKNQEKTSLGFIAQEVKQVIPEVVSADSEGYYAIGYQSLIAVLSEAIKEQQTIIDALTARVEALENNR